MATIAFFPEGAFGPTNNCIGIGDVLRSRGHDVVFIIEESFAGNLEAKGFEERLMRLGPPPEEPEVPGQFWKDYIRDTAPVFRKPTIEQLEGFIAPTFEALVDGARYVDSRLEQIIGDLEPDVIVEDNVVSFPALSASGRPWVRISSCNPAEMKDPAVPPTFSGYTTDGREGWDEYWAEYRRTLGELQSRFDAFCRDRGAPALPELEFMHESPYLNLYLYPAEVDYPRERALGERWHNLETSVRGTDEPWDVPDELRDGPGALIYLSLGSLGSADVELMRRLVAVLAETPHRYIVSKGPRADEFALPDTMWGDGRLPQTSIIPKVDLVITHGGNNTTTEALHFGKPMIVLPLFWDQYDNAQRVHELGFGIRLDTYAFEDHELRAAIDRLLADANLRVTMAANGERIRATDGKVKAADLIEKLS